MHESISYREFLCLVARVGSVPSNGGHGEAVRLEVHDVEAERALETRGLIKGEDVTERGMDALEPYRVRRAIILAAGRGVRMQPATRTVPKPMVAVLGEPTICRALDALCAAGITDVHVVRGYLGEQLEPLLERYPGMRLIDNPDYARTNNITSLMAARHLLGSGSYVMDADLVLRRPELISPFQYRSNYLGIPMSEPRGWCFETDGDGRITDAGVSVNRGVHQIVGVSYWTPEDGARLSEDLPRAFAMPGGSQRYWDTVAIQFFPERYELHVRPCAAEDVVELDTFDELCAFDPSYLESCGIAEGGAER